MDLNKESYFKMAIQEQIYRMPKEFEQYANYLIEEKKLTYSEAHSQLVTIEAYYNVLAMHYHMIAYKISPDELSTPCEAIFNYLKRISNREKTGLADFYSWLEIEQIIFHSFIKYPEEPEKENYIPKNPNPKKIKSADDVKFFKDNIKNYAQTTVDHKYSLEKCFKSRYTDYTYMIHDNESDTYFCDQKGVPLEIKKYVDAREFIKNLYRK